MATEQSQAVNLMNDAFVLANQLRTFINQQLGDHISQYNKINGSAFWNAFATDVQTAIFIPPSLCGCELKITAEFLPGAVRDGISYQHPLHIRAEGPQGEIIGTTIQDIQIKSVCGLHAKHQEKMPDVSRFFDVRVRNWETGIVYWHPGNLELTYDLETVEGEAGEQHRGYLVYPLTDETPAARLYTLLSMHRGQVHSYSCGCASFLHFDEDNHALNPNAMGTYLKHPRFSYQCWKHKGDTVDMRQARGDNCGIITVGMGLPCPSERFEVIAA